MSAEQDPPRLIEDEEDELGALFRAGRGVPEVRLSEVRARLMARPLWMKPWTWGMGLVVVGLAVGGAMIFRAPSPAGPTEPTPETGALEISPSLAMPQSLEDHSPPHESPPYETGSDTPNPPPMAPTAESSRSPRAPRTRAAVPDAAPPSPEPVQPLASMPSEYQLILAARQALRSRRSHARNSLDTHERLYPDGTLREEREALRVELLWTMGDRAEAEAARRRFERAFPTSAHRARLDELLNSP